MIWIVFVLWALLGVAGSQVAQRVGLHRERGVLARAGVGYVTSLAAITPVAVLGYAFSWPIEVLSAALALVCIVGLGLAAANLPAWLRDATPASAFASLHRADPIAIVCALVILVDLALALRSGPGFVGDARFHLARARTLFDHGFNQWDPYLAGKLFTRVYHTNLYHAVLAAAARLTGSQPFEVWAGTLAWAKLASASAVYALTRCVTNRPRLAWAAAAATAIWHAPIEFAVYPNKIAPGWLWPLAVAYGVQLLTGGGARALAKFAMVCLLLPLWHPLYAAFTALLLGPVLACWWWRNRDQRRWLALGALSLLFCLPHLVVSHWHGPYTEGPPAPYPTLAKDQQAGKPPPGKRARPPRRGARVTKVGGFVTADPRPWMDPFGTRWLMALGILAGFMSGRRRHYAALLAVVVAWVAVLYVPPLCTAVVKLAGGREWVIDRLAVLWIPLLWPALAGFVQNHRIASWRWVDAVVPGLMLALGWHWGTDGGHHTRASYLSRALSNRAQSSVARLERERAYFAGRFEPGDTILANPGMPGNVTMVSDVFFVGVAHAASPNLPDYARRRNDCWAMLHQPKMTPSVRRKLMAYYGVDRIYVTTRRPAFRRRDLNGLRKRFAGMMGRLHLGDKRLVIDIPPSQ